MTNAPTAASTAVVTTERPARFGKQLVAHLGRHSGGEWSDDEGTGWISLGEARAEVEARSEALILRVYGPTDDLDDLEDVVGRHLVRFTRRGQVTVRWVRADGRAGTEQRTQVD
ncbi:DUF2218 domain-containing protein [Streptomyces sp. NBC_00258]|uniref:DUF2218 domain-containing protein n=1 Tax=Streptomyces sp. NBC_00258 TaxID=2903642 RepID=UPI002E2C8BDA|nr:DUF2218 domain-containing protein [Streptomyces sp. NBC_00258]